MITSRVDYGETARKMRKCFSWPHFNLFSHFLRKPLFHFRLPYPSILILMHCLHYFSQDPQKQDLAKDAHYPSRLVAVTIYCSGDISAVHAAFFYMYWVPVCEFSLSLIYIPTFAVSTDFADSLSRWLFVFDLFRGISTLICN